MKQDVVLVLRLNEQENNMTWILVFWLSTPSNFTSYTTYGNEYDCKKSALIWNGRLEQVKSKLIAECRMN
jgi:hypothetical protein